MNQLPRVAIVADDRRHDAVAQALHLLGDTWPHVPATGAVIKPNLVSHSDLRASSHPNTVATVADFLYSRGAEHLTVAEGATDATAGFENLGLRRLLWGRPVTWFDINRDEKHWKEIELRGTNGSMRPSRVSSTIVEAGLYVSVALAKTHVNTMMTASLKNQMSCLHPQDRIQMHGYQAGGNGYTGLKQKVVQWLKGDSAAVAWATTVLGRAKQARMIGQKMIGRMDWENLSPPQLEFVKSVAAMHSNLVRLNQTVKPRLAIVDGFSTMDGEGPRFGRSRNLGWVVAGSDPVAVDTVVAHLMGLDVNDIGYLVLADQAGLGSARLDQIELVGDPIQKLARKCRKHSHTPLHRLWRDALPFIGEPQPTTNTAFSYNTHLANNRSGKGVANQAKSH